MINYIPTKEDEFSFNLFLVTLVIALSIGLLSAVSNHYKGEKNGYAECGKQESNIQQAEWREIADATDLS